MMSRPDGAVAERAEHEGGADASRTRAAAECDRRAPETSVWPAPVLSTMTREDAPAGRSPRPRCAAGSRGGCVDQCTARMAAISTSPTAAARKSFHAGRSVCVSPGGPHDSGLDRRDVHPEPGSSGDRLTAGASPMVRCADSQRAPRRRPGLAASLIMQFEHGVAGANRSPGLRNTTMPGGQIDADRRPDRGRRRAAPTRARPARRRRRSRCRPAGRDLRGAAAPAAAGRDRRRRAASPPCARDHRLRTSRAPRPTTAPRARAVGLRCIRRRVRPAAASAPPAVTTSARRSAGPRPCSVSMHSRDLEGVADGAPERRLHARDERLGAHAVGVADGDERPRQRQRVVAASS